MRFKDKIKRPGHCTWCDTPVFEIKEHKSCELVEKYPAKIGKALSDANRVEYLLGDGTLAHCTACDQCLPDMTDFNNFPALWDKILKAFVLEISPKFRAMVGAQPHDAVQMQNIKQEIVRQLVPNYIMMTVLVRKWSEVT